MKIKTIECICGYISTFKHLKWQCPECGRTWTCSQSRRNYFFQSGPPKTHPAWIPIRHLLNAVVIGTFIFLVGCSQTEKVEVTIHHVYDNPSKWGCVGTNFETYVQTKDGRMSKICGNWGKQGDTLTGYWTEGHWIGEENGFHLNR